MSPLKNCIANLTEEEVFDEDNIFKSKTTQDHCLSLWPIKRLKSHILFREEPLE